MSPILALVVMLVAFAGVAIHSGPIWVQVAVLSLLAVVVVPTFAVMLYLAVRNPDALRSESYGLAREAMERGYAGDSVVGLMRAEGALPALTVEATSSSSTRPAAPGPTPAQIVNNPEKAP